MNAVGFVSSILHKIMGACGSKSELPNKHGTSPQDSKVSQLFKNTRRKPPEDPKLDRYGRLLESEIELRKVASPQSETFHLADGTTITYAHLTQRGFYPDDYHKANQDRVCVTRSFCGTENDAFMGVYDGHGSAGEDCAQYAMTQLPKLLQKTMETNLKSNTENLSNDEFEKSCHTAHVDCNRRMHEDKSIDDNLSGTTAISAWIHGNKMTISNVGDSRAIMAKRRREEPPTTEDEIDEKPASSSSENDNSSLHALPLSQDQVPYRRDELERVKKAGSRVLTLDQVDGIESIHENWTTVNLGERLDVDGNPPRIWLQEADYPGCAFTRSLGDAVADTIGVFAEPEMFTTELKSDCKMVILASDGVFEFMTNKDVVDLCATFDDPLKACHAVVRKSYDLWMEQETRTDDITVIIMFLDVKADGITETPFEDVLQNQPQQEPTILAGARKKREKCPSIITPGNMDNVVAPDDMGTAQMDKEDEDIGNPT